MADTVISDLPSKTSLLDSDLLPVDDGAQTYQVTGAQLKEWLALQNKADVDLSNLSSTGENHFATKDLDNITTAGKNVSIGWGKPDMTAGVAIPSGVTIQAAGFVTFQTLDIYNASAQAYIDGYNAFTLTVVTGAVKNVNMIPVYPGQVITFTNMQLVTFFPLAINA